MNHKNNSESEDDVLADTLIVKQPSSSTRKRKRNAGDDDHLEKGRKRTENTIVASHQSRRSSYEEVEDNKDLIVDVQPTIKINLRKDEDYMQSSYRMIKWKLFKKKEGSDEYELYCLCGRPFKKTYNFYQCSAEGTCCKVKLKVQSVRYAVRNDFFIIRDDGLFYAPLCMSCKGVMFVISENPKHSVYGVPSFWCNCPSTPELKLRQYFTVTDMEGPVHDQFNMTNVYAAKKPTGKSSYGATINVDNIKKHTSLDDKIPVKEFNNFLFADE